MLVAERILWTLKAEMGFPPLPLLQPQWEHQDRAGSPVGGERVIP